MRAVRSMKDMLLSLEIDLNLNSGLPSCSLFPYCPDNCVLDDSGVDYSVFKNRFRSVVHLEKQRSTAITVMLA